MKKSILFGLVVINLSGFYFLFSQYSLWRSSDDHVDWVLNMLGKVRFEKTDSSIPKSRYEIYPVEGEEREALMQMLKVDINHASFEELLDLPRVGPSIAQRIIEERSANGPFKNWNDLSRVKGLGPKSVDALKSWIRFGEEL